MSISCKENKKYTTPIHIQTTKRALLKLTAKWEKLARVNQTNSMVSIVLRGIPILQELNMLKIMGKVNLRWCHLLMVKVEATMASNTVETQEEDKWNLFQESAHHSSKEATSQTKMIETTWVSKTLEDKICISNKISTISHLTTFKEINKHKDNQLDSQMLSKVTRVITSHSHPRDIAEIK